jgi:hypothetical protein
MRNIKTHSIFIRNECVEEKGEEIPKESIVTKRSKWNHQAKSPVHPKLQTN